MAKVFVPFQQQLGVDFCMVAVTTGYNLQLDITELLCDDSFNKYTSTICKTVSAAAITRIHIYAL